MKVKKLLGDSYFPPEMSEAALAIRDLEFERDEYESGYEHYVWLYKDARSLIDGCYEVVELFDAKTPSQVEWKRKWLEAARQHGASSF